MSHLGRFLYLGYPTDFFQQRPRSLFNRVLIFRAVTRFSLKALPGFEPGISCLLDRRINRYATAPVEAVSKKIGRVAQV